MPAAATTMPEAVFIVPTRDGTGVNVIGTNEDTAEADAAFLMLFFGTIQDDLDAPLDPDTVPPVHAVPDHLTVIEERECFFMRSVDPDDDRTARYFPSLAEWALQYHVLLFPCECGCQGHGHIHV